MTYVKLLRRGWLSGKGLTPKWFGEGEDMGSGFHRHDAKGTRFMPIDPCSLVSCYYAFGGAEVRVWFGPS